MELPEQLVDCLGLNSQGALPERFDEWRDRSRDLPNVLTGIIDRVEVVFEYYRT